MLSSSGRVIDHMNPFSNLKPYSPKTNFNFVFPSYSFSFKWLLSFRFSTKILHHCLLSPLRQTHYTPFIYLNLRVRNLYLVRRTNYEMSLLLLLLLSLLTSSLVTGLFFLVLLLNQRWSPPLRLQASHCSTFRIMCDVPSIAVFCIESIECFPGTASQIFL
jgi:hypothetical protein